MGQHLSVFTVKKHTIFLQTFIYSIHILYIVHYCMYNVLYIQYVQCTKYSTCIYKYSILSGFNLRCYKNYLCASWKLLFFTVWVSTQLEHFSHWAPPLPPFPPPALPPEDNRDYFYPQFPFNFAQKHNLFSPGNSSNLC